MKNTTNINKQRQSRWLITGATTMILAVTAIANQTALADNLPDHSAPDQTGNSQTTTPNALRQPKVSLKTEQTLPPATVQSADNTSSSTTMSTQTKSETSMPSATSTVPTSSATPSVTASESASNHPVSHASATTSQETATTSQLASPVQTSIAASQQTSSLTSSAAQSVTSSESTSNSSASQASAATSQETSVTSQFNDNDQSTGANQLAKTQTVQPATLASTRMAIADESIDDWMPNKLLQQEVLRQLRKQNPSHTWNSAADITQADMQLLTTYYGTNTYIDGTTDYSLGGLQYATNLTTISLNNGLNSQVPTSHYYGDVSDLTPLAGLTKLTSVDIQNNRVTDISPLKNLTNLQTLAASFNHIADFSSLKDLPNLKDVTYGNQVVVNLNPILINKSNPNYHLTSPFRNYDGSAVTLQPVNGIAEPITINTSTYQFSYKFYFNGATGVTSDGNGGLNFTNLQAQPTQWWSGDANGQYQGMTVVPVKDFYYMVGAYSVGTVYFAVIQAYELTDTAQPVTVKYQDAQGNTLADDTILNGLIGETYSATAKSFTNYRLVSTSGNPTGTFSDTAQTVIFTYTRMDAGSITFKFQDKNGTTLATDQTLPGTGSLGLSFDIAAPAIANYLTPANATGTMTLEDQIYTFIYTRKDAADVTIQYQDENGQQLAPNKVLSGKELLNAEVPDQTIEIPNYILNKIVGDSHFTATAHTVTYVYKRGDAADVTIKYQDENGTKLADDVTLSGLGNLGLEIPDQLRTIPGYTYKEIQNRALGLFTDQPQTIVYVYTRNVAKPVTVKYQDENGKTLHDDVLLNGYEGDPYASEQLTIAGYTFKNVQGNTVGLFTDQPQTVTYIYTRTAGQPVTVQYQDENGKSLHADILLNGYEGDSYTSEQLTIPGYTFKTVQGNAIGTFTGKPQTVTYVYTRTAGQPVTVQYQDENGKSLHDDILLNGYEGDSYTSEQLAIPGYTFKTVQGNATGTFTGKPQTVTYVYTRTAGQPVAVQYQDENGKSLHDDILLSGFEGDSYASEQLTIPGYTFKTVQGNTSGTFTDQPQTVTYIYTRTAGQPVTVRYQDENGKSLHDDILLNGFEGDPYTSEQLTIPGYTFKTVQGNDSGTFTDQPQTVTYVYTRTAGQPVTVKYQDENGKTLHADILLNGYEGDPYTSEQLKIAGYTFKTVQGNTTGTFTDKPQTVTYVYTRTAGQSVTVKYLDGNGKSLHPDILLNGYEGDPYASEQLTIAGYTFKSIQGNATGTFTDKPQTVTYIYTRATGKAVTVKYQDENGTTLHPDITLSGILGDTYQTKQLAIEGYTFKSIQGNASGTFTSEPQTVTYVYIRATGKAVTVKYQDENGTTLHPDITLNGALGDRYQTAQLAINGYTFKAVHGNVTGTFSAQAQTVTYVYTPNAPVNPAATGTVTVHYVTKDGKTLKDVILSGRVGTAYQTSSLTFTGYHLVTTPANANGQYTDGNQNVTYVYEVVPTTDSGNGDHLKPEKPTLPAQPTKPGQVTTVQPDHVTTKPGVVPTKVQPAQAKATAQKVTGDLPQTNENPTALGAIWLGVLSLLAGLGLIKKRKN